MITVILLPSATAEGMAEIEAAIAAGACITTAFVETCAEETAFNVFSSKPEALPVKITLPVAVELKTHVNTDEAPPAIVREAGRSETLTDEGTDAAGVTGSTDRASAVPLLVTVIKTVICCPALINEGDAVIEAASEAGVSILTAFETAAAEFIVFPILTSTALAPAFNEMLPAVAAVYTHVR